MRRVEAGQLADAVTLKAEFEHSGVLDEVGGTGYLAQLLSAMVGSVAMARAVEATNPELAKEIIAAARAELEDIAVRR